jgi:hypothetical protein
METKINAYWWRFNNFTTKTLLLKVKLRASNNPYYAIVYPNASALFDWSPPNAMAGFCFDTLQWMQVPKEILNNRNLIDTNGVISHEQMNNFLTDNQARFHLKDASIHYVLSETYKKTIKYAQSLFGKKIIKWAAKQHARSACKSRHISILEDEDKTIKFYSQ